MPRRLVLSTREESLVMRWPFPSAQSWIILISSLLVWSETVRLRVDRQLRKSAIVRASY